MIIGLLRAAARAADMNLRMSQVFHVHQDGAGIRIARQVIDDIAEIDIGAVAQRYDLAQANAARPGPIEHAGDQQPDAVRPSKRTR
jgi:hypothetical protein